MCRPCGNGRRSELDVTKGLPKHVTISYCYECESYLQPPETRIKAELESSELLTFCLEQLDFEEAELTLVHAWFVWTEPHSGRIKVKLRVQKWVAYGEVLDQSQIVEYVIHNQMCDNCFRLEPEPWVAAKVQLRHHVPHNQGSFFYLEQLILKHDVAGCAIRINQMDNGIDYLFPSEIHGVKFVEFVHQVALIKSRCDKERVSNGTNGKIYYKYNFYVEIAPICPDDLVCLPLEVAIRLGDLGPLVLCTRVNNGGIMFMDPNPNSIRCCFLEADQYWSSPFSNLVSSGQLVEYFVLDINNVTTEVNGVGCTYALADVQVARLSDFGRNDTVYNIRTHLGHLLSPGDYALGYDLYDMELDKYVNHVLPQVLLVKRRVMKTSVEENVVSPVFGSSRISDMEVDDTARR